ncbi:MAG: energy transducer TonB [Rhizomicrobium sp.]
MTITQSRTALCVLSLCALAFSGPMLWSADASPEESPPHVDLSRPHPQPPYPDSALAGREQGTVLVDLYVWPDGRVAKYRVAQSSGFGDLDDAAVEGLLNWHFIPAVRDGDSVSDWTAVKIVFQLPQPPLAPPHQPPK